MIVCSRCGSGQIWQTAVVDPNTQEVLIDDHEHGQCMDCDRPDVELITDWEYSKQREEERGDYLYDQWKDEQ